MKNIGKVSITLEGLNVEKFLNFLTTSNIDIYNIVRNEHSNFTITIDSHYKKKIISDAEKFGYKVTIGKKSGIYSVFSFALARFVLVCSLIFMLSVYLFSNMFLWKINISGNNLIRTSSIINFLADNGIAVGKIKGSIDNRGVEKLLRDNFPDIALVSTEIYGNSLNINISEKLAKNYLDYSPLTSAYNGVVREFELVSGSSNIRVGDVVSVGQILVEPYIMDSAGNRKSINAKANLCLEVDFNYTIEYNENREIYEDTGNTFVYSNYSLWGLNFKKSKTCPYKNYRLEKQEYYVLNSMFLPIKKTRYRYFEQSPKPAYVPFDEVKESVIRDAYLELDNLARGQKIFDKKYNIVKVGNIYYVTASCKAMIKIGDKYDNNN
mgnify:CR=1 FL=1